MPNQHHMQNQHHFHLFQFLAKEIGDSKKKNSSKCCQKSHRIAWTGQHVIKPLHCKIEKAKSLKIDKSICMIIQIRVDIVLHKSGDLF